MNRLQQWRARRASTLQKNIVPVKNSPLLIPELLERILSHLSPVPLRCSASLVCRQWRQIARTLIPSTASFCVMSPPEGPKRALFLQKLASATTLTCQRGSHPNYYVPPQPLGLEEASWSALLADLTQISNTPAGLKIRSFTLFSDADSRTWSMLVPFLATLGSSLMSLRLDRMSLNAVIPLVKILELCPVLKDLYLASFEDMYWHKGAQLEEPTDTNTELEAQTRTWPIQTCTFENMILTETALEPFIKACPELEELRLVCIPPASSSVRSVPNNCIFFKPKARAAFYRRLESYCPKLKSFHISLSHRMTLPTELTKDLLPFQELPFIENWGLSPKALTPETFSSLNTLGSEHRITVLEIIGNHGGFTTTQEAELGMSLHEFLCQSSSLLHLKAAGIKLPLESLRAPQAKVWACRNLKTLHAQVIGGWRLGPQMEAVHRMVFGYIARVCPRLQELYISQPGEMMRLKSGMCLLSRLKDLRRLRLMMSEWPTGCSIDDLDWIRRHYVNDVPQHRTLPGLLRQLFKGQNKPPAKSRVSFSEHTLFNDVDEKNGPGTVAPPAQQTTDGAPLDDSDKEKDGGSCMVDGVDMKHLGELEDVHEYFYDRLAHPDECLWPEFEALEVRYKYTKGGRFVDELPLIMAVMTKFRPEVRVDVQKQEMQI